MGFTPLVSKLRSLEVELVVLEATGGLQARSAAAIAAAGLPVAVVNPRQVRDFAKASGRLARPTPWMLRLWPTSGRR